MDKSPKFRAKSYSDGAKANQQRAEQLAQAEELIMERLVQLGAPHITPVEIAPLLGITPNTFRYHCRNCRAIRTWSTGWKFMLDDKGHVEALRSVIKVAVWSVKSLPEELRPKVH